MSRRVVLELVLAPIIGGGIALAVFLLIACNTFATCH